MEARSFSMSNFLTSLPQSSTLYVLYLVSHRAYVYRAKSGKIQLIQKFAATDAPPAEFAQLVEKNSKVPWALLVDQSEEMFQTDSMPNLRGTAKKAWLMRLSAKAGEGTPYRQWLVQGKNRAEPDKLDILGYSLGRVDVIASWLNALQACKARIRGMYAPAMLTPDVCKTLKIKLSNSSKDVSVLVTPSAEGLRQTVLVGGRVRFSRFVLTTKMRGGSWLETVYKESTRLREYLTNAQLLPSDQTEMSIYVVRPQEAVKLATTAKTLEPNKNDHYKWLNDPAPTQLYIKALSKAQSWQQLAPAAYRWRDQSLQLSGALYMGCAVLSLVAMALVLMMGWEVWQKSIDTDMATKAAKLATNQYQTVAKTFLKSPLTTSQLLDMRQRWEDIQSSASPEMEDLLKVAGQTLERHPSIILDELEWSVAPPVVEAPNLPPKTVKVKNDAAALVLKGSIRGIASDDLRGTRDALAKLETDFSLQSNIRVEVIRRPLDLSAKAVFSGSSTQEKSELNFEIKLWQR